MKTRKSLAFILALVMMLTLIPASAFATSTNTVANTPTVAADGAFTASINLKLNEGSTVPANAIQKLGISLTNAEFAAYSGVNFVSGSAVSQLDTASAIGVVFGGVGGINIPTVATIVNNKADALFSVTSNAAIGNPDSLTLTFNLVAGKDAGEVKVAIDARDTFFTSGTYVVANVAGGATVATVAGKVPTIGDRGTTTTAAIQIDEVALGSLKSKTQKVKLILPKGFIFEDTAPVTIVGTPVSGDIYPAIANVTCAAVVGDDRAMTVEFETTGAPYVARRTISISPRITSTSDAKAGDVAIRVLPINTGDNTVAASTDLVVAKYIDEGVAVTTVTDIPEIFAGRVEKDTATSYLVKVTLKEAAPQSLVNGRYVKFEFPKEVQIATKGALAGQVEYSLNSAAASIVGLVDAKADVTKDTSSFEWKVTGVPVAKASTVEFKIPVTVAADYKGDINLTVSGSKAGVTETKLVVAKAVAPITSELVIKDIRTGVQNQVVGDIVIKETVAGAFRAVAGNNKVNLQIDDNGQSIGISSGKVYLTKGDLELKEADGKDIATLIGTVKLLQFEVKNYSVKTPGEITIKDVKLTLNRTPAEGKYQLLVGGTSIVDNGAYRNGEFSGNVVSADYVNVATPAEQGVNSSFVIGNKTYTVNGVTKEMDAAPYIDAASRTMVPIRYIGYALGLTDYQVLWNPATSTATLFGKSTVVITVGKDTLSVNGAIVPMDTKAVNKDGRIYVPARYIGNALGAQVEWDQASSTVAIYTVK